MARKTRRYLGLFDWDVHERIRTNASRAATTSNATAASPPPSISQQADQQQAQQGSAAAVPTTDLSIQQQQQEQPGGRREFIDDATALPATAPTSLPGAQHQQRLPTDQDDLTHDDYAHIRRRRSLFSRSRQPAHDRPAGAPQRRRSSFAALPLPHASYAHRSRRRALQQEQPLRNDAATVAPACAAPPAPGLYYGSLPCRPVPLLVAYHPAVPLHLAHNRTAFQVLLRGLAQVSLGSLSPGTSLGACQVVLRGLAQVSVPPWALHRALARARGVSVSLAALAAARWRHRCGRCEGAAIV